LSEIRKPAAERKYYKEVIATDNKDVIDALCRFFTNNNIVKDSQRVVNIKKLFYDMYGIR
jgi:hypothetical protein